MSSRNKIIYQLALRTFTPDGTIAAATKLLPHVASLGVDIVYLCPFYVEENDPDPTYWSVRQTKSGTGNPKNPYKIADYFNVDEEYGTWEDLKAFADEAHRLGLLVMYDLVYLHCGRHAVFLEEHPDFVVRNEDGTVKVPDRWPFARLNFESRELREYLMENMRMLMLEYGADGFRCDVGDSVPLDFWQEAFARLKAINPDVISLNEGKKPDYIEEVFEIGYGFDWSKVMRQIFRGELPASALRALHDDECKLYGENRGKLIRAIDNHDTASDVVTGRNEITMTSRGVDAALVICTTYGGVPLVWNGYELCDDAENCMFSNRFYGRRSAMNWSKAFTADGERRGKLVRALHRLYHDHATFYSHQLTFLEHNAPDSVIAYQKKAAGESLLVVVNATGKAVSVKLEVDLHGKPLLRSGVSRRGDRLRLQPYGYLVVRVEHKKSL